MKAVKYRFSVTNLGHLSGERDALGRGLNERGQATGAASLEPGRDHAFLYHGDHMTDIGVLPSFTFSTGEDINNHGVIVGSCANVKGTRVEERAFIYEKGVMRDLGTLGGKNSAATAINDKGWIVGKADIASGYTHAFLYRDGKMMDLGTLRGGESTAADVNIHGHVVGWDSGRAFLWKDGAMKHLEGFKGYAEAMAINDNGYVVGVEKCAYLWRDGKVKYLGGLKFLGGSFAFSINNHNQVVGTAESAQPDSNGGFEKHAFFHDGSKMYDLNKLVSEKKYRLATAYDINDAGEILCQAWLGAEKLRAILLKPL
jgi:probable HAF family extracellular repeat protein